MSVWICTQCGAVERLTFIPSHCPACRGMMETQDNRSTAAVESDAEFQMAIDAYWTETGAVVALWQNGQPLSSSMQDTIDDLLLANRVSMIETIFGQEAA